jgi:uncharacterized lipoprotein NlpE involved in copper resistance
MKNLILMMSIVVLFLSGCSNKSNVEQVKELIDQNHFLFNPQQYAADGEMCVASQTILTKGARNYAGALQNATIINRTKLVREFQRSGKTNVVNTANSTQINSFYTEEFKDTFSMEGFVNKKVEVVGDTIAVLSCGKFHNTAIVKAAEESMIKFIEEN